MKTLTMRGGVKIQVSDETPSGVLFMNGHEVGEVSTPLMTVADILPTMVISRDYAIILIDALLDKKQKIQAIKVYREATGMKAGLKDSKEFIEDRIIARGLTM